ncbi:MAG: type II secretion system protein GspL [Burkholderiales bacterium]
MKMRVWLPPLADLRPDAPLEFEVIDGRRRVTRRAEAVIAELPRGMSCELLLHPFDVLLVGVTLPRLTGAKLANALPGLVEEFVAGDIERNHVVASARDADNRAIAAVVDRALLARAMEIFKRAGLRVSEATPAALALAWRPGVWRVRLREGHGVVRTGEFAGIGFAYTGDMPVELRLLRQQSASPPSAIEVSGDCDLAAWFAALASPVGAAPPDVLSPPVVIDLLQYGFSREVIGWKTWRQSMILAGTLALVAVIGLNVSAWSMRSQEKALREAMVSIVKEAMPKVSAVLDPLRQMNQHVADLRTGAGTDRGDFLTLATRFGTIAEPDSVQSIEFGAGQFKLRFRSAAEKSSEARNRLVESAAQAGIDLVFESDSVRLTRRKSP